MPRLVVARLANQCITDLFYVRTRGPCPARVRTRKPLRCRAQHASVPQRTPHAVPSTRPHSKAVPSTSPYLNAHRTLCPARARIRTPRPSPLRRPSVRHGVLPETLDLRSTWYDATATEMLAEFVNRTLNAYPGASPPRRLVAPLPLPPLPPRRLLRLGSALLHPPLTLFEYMVTFTSGLLFLSSVLFGCVVLFFYFI